MADFLTLTPHESTPPARARSVTAALARLETGFVIVTYAVEPADSLVLPNAIGRRDGLWQTTCFELFLATVGGGYREFNFAPSAWNAYAFRDWRRGMTPLEISREPNLVDCRINPRLPAMPERYELDVVLPPDLLGDVAKVSINAVIEEYGGRKSYWALAHPPGDAPNFHHPAGFIAAWPPNK